MGEHDIKNTGCCSFFSSDTYAAGGTQPHHGSTGMASAATAGRTTLRGSVGRESAQSTRALPASNAMVLGVARYHGFESFFGTLQAKLGGHPRELTAYLMDFAQRGDTATEVLKASSLRPGLTTQPSNDSRSAAREEQP